jgi:glyoxalase/bleomycin resistance protein/dioxygenase superfamily protein
MPNLENLKKQAKQYLRWHRERYYPVAAEIRAALPRFQHLNDRQVLEASFRLSDAQELVARQIGFEGWQALKAGAKQTISRPVLSSTAAQLFISDMKISCEFFTAKLGFSIEFLYGDPPYYGEVSRNNALLGLRLVCEPAFVADIREREQLLSAAITVDTAAEIKQLFLDFQAAEVKFYQTLKKQPWGARNFIVLDPHGNLILFAGPGD